VILTVGLPHAWEFFLAEVNILRAKALGTEAYERTEQIAKLGAP
jgi:hypothetical protein